MRTHRTIDPVDAAGLDWYPGYATSEIVTTCKFHPPPVPGRPFGRGKPEGRREGVLRCAMSAPIKRPKIVDGNELWECRRCFEWKPASEFNKQRAASNGLGSYCRSCVSEYDKKRIVTYRKQKRKVRAEYNRKNRENNRIKNARYRAENKDRLKERAGQLRKRHPEKFNARSAVSYALETGRLTKPAHCEACDQRDKIEAHHDNYGRDRWLVVTWLCRTCHLWMHARWREQERDAKNKNRVGNKQRRIPGDDVESRPRLQQQSLSVVLRPPDG